MIKFSVIIVSYKNLELLKNCLETVNGAVTNEIEIIVVDNNSGSDVKEYLEARQNIILIKNKSNVGFGRANNQAAAIARGRWLVLLNNDTKVSKDFFRKAELFFNSNSGYNIMGPLVLSPDGFPQPTFYNKDYYRQLILPSLKFRKLVKSLSFGTDTTLKKRLLYNISTEYSFVSTHEVDSLSGVCMFIDRKVYEDIGLFDENYFMYVEDLDFCLRARRNNYKMAFYPEIIVNHYIKALKYKSSVRWENYNNNLIYFYRKNFPWYISVPAHLVLTLKAFLRHIVIRP